jgi:probable DNA repair protein
VDAAVAESLAAGRTLVVASRHRAAALQQAWARARVAAGDAVWRTPEILTFDAWLAREWLRARDQGRLLSPRQLLNAAQERRIWAQVLSELEQQGGGEPLVVHAQALVHAATRARRSLVDVAAHAVTAEERLLAAALARVDRVCESRGWLVPGLARPADLAGLDPDPPLFVGFTELPPLARSLTAIAAAGPGVMAPLPAPQGTPLLFAAVDARDELRAAAAWCRELLREDPARRLLVVNRGASLPMPLAGELLWQSFAIGTRASLGEAPDPSLLTVEGGQPLLTHALVSDALAALELATGPVTFAALSRLLRSPHFELLPQRQGLAVELALREGHPSHHRMRDVLAALQALERDVPGSARLGAALGGLAALATGRSRSGAAVWAARFDEALRALGFPGPLVADSRAAQRLARWNELLDEFATLDAVGSPLDVAAALALLRELARQGRHDAASLDASITLTAEGGDPLVHYDGIWVLGLTEAAWPEAPRPDPFVSLAQQVRGKWPEANVALRARQARGELAAWQARTSRLILSHALHDGDVPQRPARLVADLDPWAPADPATPVPAPALECIVDESLAPLATAGAPLALHHGTRVVELQHQCAFRAQAQLRLGAEPLETPPEGINARVRGQLLHAALEALWGTLGSRDALLALDAGGRAALCERSWEEARRKVLARLPLPPGPRALERERERDLELLHRLLEIESARGPFSVESRERRLEATFDGPTLRLQLDRIDAFADGSHRIIDYKSGRAPRIRARDDPPDPLQLAVYATALDAAGERPAAVALMSASRVQPRYAGVGAAGSEAAQGLDEVDDWEALLPCWRAAIVRLVHEHVAGAAAVEPLDEACRTCHLHGFCGIGADEGSDDE